MCVIIECDSVISPLIKKVGDFMIIVIALLHLMPLLSIYALHIVIEDIRKRLKM